MTLLAATVVSLVVLAPLCAHSQTIKITRAGSRPSRSGPAENFTGSVRVDPLFQAEEASRIAIQEQHDGKTVDWMEKVSDEQYRTGSSAE